MSSARLMPSPDSPPRARAGMEPQKRGIGGHGGVNRRRRGRRPLRLRRRLEQPGGEEHGADSVLHDVRGTILLCFTLLLQVSGYLNS